MCHTGAVAGFSFGWGQPGKRAQVHANSKNPDLAHYFLGEAQILFKKIKNWHVRHGGHWFVLKGPDSFYGALVRPAGPVSSIGVLICSSGPNSFRGALIRRAGPYFVLRCPHPSRGPWFFLRDPVSLVLWSPAPSRGGLEGRKNCATSAHQISPLTVPHSARGEVDTVMRVTQDLQDDVTRKLQSAEYS